MKFVYGKILFANAETSICNNGGDTKAFPILRDVKQGCSLAPYLFLFVSKAFNIDAKHKLSTGELKGITLPTEVAKHLLVNMPMT